MGMFDTVICEKALPDQASIKSFQTKDLARVLSTYKISKDGKLLLHVHDVQQTGRWYKLEGIQRVEYDEKPAPDKYGPWPIMERVNERWKDTKYHGEFSIYGGDAAGHWHEYIVKFTDGKLVSITADVESNTRIRKIMNENKAKLEGRNRKLR